MGQVTRAGLLALLFCCVTQACALSEEASISAPEGDQSPVQAPNTSETKARDAVRSADPAVVDTPRSDTAPPDPPSKAIGMPAPAAAEAPHEAEPDGGPTPSKSTAPTGAAGEKTQK